MATTGHWYIAAATGAKVDFTDPSADIDFTTTPRKAKRELLIVKTNQGGSATHPTVQVWKPNASDITAAEITAAIADQDDDAVPTLQQASDPPSGTKGAAITAVAAPAAAITGGEPPTEAEFNALRTVVANLVTAVNALIESQEDQGELAEN